MTHLILEEEDEAVTITQIYPLSQRKGKASICILTMIPKWSKRASSAMYVNELVPQMQRRELVRQCM